MSSVYLLVGAPAVGKSSTARALALRFTKSIHIPVDDLRDMVESGMAYPGAEWSAALVEQLKLARQTASQMAADYSKAGFDVVIDDFWDPTSKLIEYEDLRGLPEVHRVVLLPSQEAAQARNLKRSGSGAASDYIAAGIQLVYESLESDVDALRGQGWLVLDTTADTIDGAVDRILGQTGVQSEPDAGSGG